MNNFSEVTKPKSNSKQNSQQNPPIASSSFYWWIACSLFSLIIIIGIGWYILGVQLSFLWCVPFVVLFVGFLSWQLKKTRMWSWVEKMICASKRDPYSVIGIFIAIASVAFSSITDVLSQGDGIHKSIDILYESKHEQKWTDLIDKADNSIITIIVDNSGSLSKMEVSKPFCDKLNKAVKNANLSKNSNGDTYSRKYSDVVKAELKLLLNELRKNKVIGRYKVLIFSDAVSELKSEADISTLSINEINKITEDENLNFEGVKTDFAYLLNQLAEEYCETSNGEKHSFIFLSDYIHDVKDKKNDSESIITSFKKFRDKSIYSNIYFAEELIENRNTKEGNVFLVDELIVEKVNQLKLNKLNILDKGFTIDIHAVPKPMRFYYLSSIYDSVTTYITDLPDAVLVDVKKRNEDYRQKFYANGKELYNGESPIKLAGKTLDVTIKGHIPFQYPFAELTIRDEKKHLDCSFEILFLKRIPLPFKWFIPIFFCLLSSYLTLLLVPSKTDSEGEQKSKSTTGDTSKTTSPHSSGKKNKQRRR
ncbi:MAG: hypothetical protein LBM06_07945 [Prevotellaceae bacterium]|jgi:hypothetical protein|nr:hypothetical protein [Prevotellaceae bacterium]